MRDMSRSCDKVLGMESTTRRQTGHGIGYCYVAGKRAIVVCADSLDTCRLMVCPSAKLRGVRAYRANPARKVYIFQR